MNLKLKTGVLLHITSLPGKWGMGELGQEARRFGEFLAESGQNLWQILPTGPIGYGFSPYSSSSAFAGNPLLISFDELIEEGLLSEECLSSFPTFDANEIDFPAVIDARMSVLNGVCERFVSTQPFLAFCEKEASWLDEYALFASIREANDDRPWTEWQKPLRDRDFQALEDFSETHASEIRRHKILQFLFSNHWKKMKDFFQTLEIQIVGDIPIFVAGDSVDVWANRDLFFLNTDGKPSVVAGVPPDYFSETGQRWGNPLYNWPEHKKTNYAWWTERMRRIFEMVDVVRIDHFRAFEDYWEIPAEEPTAMKGRWVKGPNLEFFQTLEENLRAIPMCGTNFCLADQVIAEDLGEITKEVEKLCLDCKFPGMDVLHFRFGETEMKTLGYQPEGSIGNRVVYTGTHDNNTSKAWLKSLPTEETDRIRRYLNLKKNPTVRDLCELTLRSPAKWAILPMQDILGLGASARMNTPGTTKGNWRWRFSCEQITPKLKQWLSEITKERSC